MMQPLPEIGKVYKFYNDGEVKESMQYDALVLDVISIGDARDELVDWFDPEFCMMTTRELYDVWLEESCFTSWIFAKDTDYLIECAIPEYDVNHIWFARTKEGDWFSMSIQSNWQRGILDVTNKLTEKLNKKKSNDEVH